MMDRFRGCSSLLALAIASVGALSACEQSQPQEQLAQVTSALSTLHTGDVAVTCMFTTNDALQVTTLAPMDVLTDLRYTDREANAAGQFNTGENVDVLIPITSANDASTTVPAGTSFLYPEAGLGDGTEQVFLYQGLVAPTDGAAPGYQLIWGFQVSPAPADGGTQADPGWVAVRDDANSLSERPTTLVGFSAGLYSGTSTNYAYDSSKGLSGTKAQLQALISNPANWIQGTVAAPVTCPTGFTVIPDATDAGGNDSATDAPTGTGGADGGAAGMTGTTDAGTGGATGNDAAPDTATGSGGAGGATVVDSGTDVKADTGSSATDAKADTGTTTDAKVDTGSTGGTDAKVDTGSTKVDGGNDAGSKSNGSSGCGCSTASNSANISAGAWMLALAGIVMTARRRRRR